LVLRELSSDVSDELLHEKVEMHNKTPAKNAHIFMMTEFG